METEDFALKDDLQRQHDFVKSLKEKGFNFPLIAAQSFVRGMRENGYKSTATAVYEFVDNAIQAQADKIDVIMGYGQNNKTKRKPDYIAVVDNGHGMEPDMIRAAVLWGGTHREDDRTGYGRFGFGLPSAAVSIAQRFTVFSRVPDGNLYCVTIDLIELKDGKLSSSTGIVQAPQAVPAELPDFVRKVLPEGDLPHGTVILLEELDRLSPGYKESQWFQKNLLERLGLTYRVDLRTRQIRVIDSAHPKGEVSVEPIDPLFLTPGARFYDENSILAEAQDPALLSVKEEGTRAGELGMVKVRYSYMPAGFQRDEKNGSTNNRFKIMKENNGFIVLRAGRQIDVVTNVPKQDYTFINDDRNWSIEIDFQPTLDEYFGVTTNKQQITFTERMWDILKEKAQIVTVARNLRKRYRKEMDELRSSVSTSPNAKKESEQVLEESIKFRTRKPVPPTPEKMQERKQRFEAEVKRRARETGRAEQDIKAELNGWPYKVEFEDLPGAPFYRVEQVGAQLRVKINKAHQFYTNIYNGPTTSSHVRSAFEILLFVMGECEVESSGDRELFYTAERGEWSLRLATNLNVFDRRNPVADAQSAKDAEEEAQASANSATAA